MPVPKPNEGEGSQDFISRCIRVLHSSDPGRPDDQIQGMCYTSLRRARGKKTLLEEGIKMPNIRLAFFDEKKDFEKQDAKLWRKPILAFGTWRHPENRDVEFEITPEVADEIISNFKKGVPVEAPVVLTHTDDPKMKVGLIKEFIKTDVGLDAVLSVDDDEMNSNIESSDRAPGVSCWLDLEYKDKKTDEELGAVVKHVALVNHPYIEGLGSYQAVSLSDKEEIYTPLMMSEKNSSGGINMPDTITKEQAIEFLKENEKIDVASLLTESEELKSFHDRIDKGELIDKKDNEKLLSDEMVKKVREQLKLDDGDNKKPDELIKAMLEKFVELSGEQKKVVENQEALTKKLTGMEADKAVNALLSEGFALPTEKESLEELFMTDAKLFDKMAKARRSGKKLVELDEKGVEEIEQKKTEAEQDEKDLKRNIEAAQEEGLIPESGKK
jgi:hypothetical protein